MKGILELTNSLNCLLWSGSWVLSLLQVADQFRLSRINNVHVTPAWCLTSPPFVTPWHYQSLIWDKHTCELQLMLQTWPKDIVGPYWVRGDQKCWYSACYSMNHDHTLTCHEINMEPSNERQQSAAVWRAGWMPSLCSTLLTHSNIHSCKHHTKIFCCKEDTLALRIVLAHVKFLNKCISFIEEKHKCSHAVFIFLMNSEFRVIRTHPG